LCGPCSRWLSLALIATPLQVEAQAALEDAGALVAGDPPSPAGPRPRRPRRSPAEVLMLDRDGQVRRRAAPPAVERDQVEELREPEGSVAIGPKGLVWR